MGVPFEIITDSSANLSWKYLYKNKIKMISFLFFIDGIEYQCQSPDLFDGKGFFEKLQKDKTVVKTSLISTGRYIDRFTPLLKRGKDILYIGMSSGISGSMQSAKTAAAELREEFPERKIYIIDTLAASLGEGLFVIKAASMRNEGKSIEDTAETVSKMIPTMCQYFMVDDLMTLKRGGRLSGAVAIVGTALNIKPILTGNESGKIVAIGKARGRDKTIEALAGYYEKKRLHTEGHLVAIAHGGCPQEAEKLAKLIKKINPEQEILIECYEQVTGSHVGPGTVALFFEGTEK